MLNYTQLFTPHHIATIADWLEEKASCSSKSNCRTAAGVESITRSALWRR